MEDFDRINSRFHQVIMGEDWDIDKTEVAELYLNDQLEDKTEWENMDGLTIMYVPGYGRLQMIWVEDDNDQRF
jgi:hypothetical protein|tara:strand:- start:1342 stop:1560 length:219 start_codon:yes stop_codon:yes gene_type:complete